MRTLLMEGPTFGPISGQIVVAGVQACDGGTNVFNFPEVQQPCIPFPNTYSDYGLLDSVAITTIFHHSYRLLNSIRDASSHCQTLLNSPGFVAGANPANASLNNPRRRRDIFNAVKAIFEHCEKLIHDSLDTCGAFSKSSDAQILQQNLQEQLKILVLLLVEDQRALQNSRDETTDRLRDIRLCFNKIDDVIVELFHFMSSCSLASMPTQIHYNWDQPIILFDPSRIGRRIPIPQVFCTSKHDFHELLRILFRSQPWHDKIDLEEYELEDKEGKTLITAENWSDTVTAGAVLVMSMVIMKPAGTVSENGCPRCRALNIKRISQRKKCLNCGLISDVIEGDYSSENISRISKIPATPAANELGMIFFPKQEDEAFSRIRYQVYQPHKLFGPRNFARHLEKP